MSPHRALTLAVSAASASAAASVNESARPIPVACRVDVLVVGGSTGAVQAAVEAAGNGARVFLAAPYPYLGEDMTATLRLWPQPGDELDSPLVQRLFDDPRATMQETNEAVALPRPLHVKKVLDDTLLEAGLPYLYSCMPCDVLHDNEGCLGGVVFATRGGRQAVVAKVIVDATQHALVARLAGAPFHPRPTGPRRVKYVVIGGEMHCGPGIAVRLAAPPYQGPFPTPAKTSSGQFQVIEYTLEVPLPDDTDSSWAAAEQLVRSKTFDPEQQFTADALYEVPPAPIHAEQPWSGPWPGSQGLPLDALQPATTDSLYVLSANADVPRTIAEHLLFPGVLIGLGQRVGKEAALLAAKREPPTDTRVTGEQSAVPQAMGDVRELFDGIRPANRQGSIPSPERSLPVLGQYDVVVVGGGTSGAPAAIACARSGTRTLVVEQHHGLGGLGTLGAVACYFHGNRCGFTDTVAGGERWVIEQKMNWWSEELAKAGGEAWFGALGCGAFVEGQQVRGVVVVTPRGRGVVLCKVVVDTTGNADIAAAAGSPCQYTDGHDFAMLGGGLPPRDLGATNSGADYCIVDETDMLDVWQLRVYSKNKYAGAFDQSPVIATRERRRIVGEHLLSLLDELNGRTYPDTICVASSVFDHGPPGGYTLDPAFAMGVHADKRPINIPLRCCLPAELDAILVAALGISVEHDALPMIRMQPDLQNLGYAVGTAAAMAARSGKPTRELDLRALQRHLVSIGNLPETVLADTDSYPPSADAVAEAVRQLPVHQQRATLILAAPEAALPLLQQALRASQGEARLTYARMLAMLGDPTGMDDLLAAVRAVPRWDNGWNHREWRRRPDGQFHIARPGPLLSRLDCLILALGHAGDARAVPAILEKAQLLTSDDDFSHHRCVALALEQLADPAAADVLVRLLAKPGMSGHSQTSIQQVLTRQRSRPGINDVVCRQDSLRELMLARALFRCGDSGGTGEEALRRYAQDLRGHYSRHARAVLAQQRQEAN